MASISHAIRYKSRFIARCSVPLIATAGLLYDARKGGSENSIRIFTRTEAGSNKFSKERANHSGGKAFEDDKDINPLLDEVQATSKDSTDNSTSRNSGATGIFGSIETTFEEAVRNVSSSWLPTTDEVQKPEVLETEYTYQGIGTMLTNFINPNISNESLNDVLEQVRSISGRGEIQDSVCAMEVLDLAQRCQEMLGTKISTFFGEKGLPPLQLTQLLYFIEKEDEIKNPSWKRRKHYFFPGINVEQMNDLNEKLSICSTSYADTVEEIRDRLDTEWDSELVYCSLESLPNKPAHFIAVKRNQSYWSNELEVLLVVCGTKGITDVITDLLCDAEPYRYGYAHSGIRESGQWIANKHRDLLEKLRTLSKKKTIKLNLLGHSLGAGAATIAGIELNDSSLIDVEVVGFGCPALLSSDLSESYKNIITTVIGDNDCVPRMSMATMINALVDITGFDYTPFAIRDLEESVDEFQRYLPSLVDSAAKKKILKNLSDLLPEHSSIDDEESTRRMEVVLYPPGRCIHFYSDGFGTAGSVVPCTFFDELDFNRRLLHDHLIQQGYEKIFLDLMRQYKNDNNYKFKNDG